MLGGGIVLLNPELRCSLLGLCGNNKPQEAATPPPPPPKEEEQEDDNGNPIFITNTPPPVIVTPPSPVYYPVPTPPQVIRYATNGCCECKTHSDGIVRCRTKPYGDYTTSYRSAKYDVNRAASLCAKNKCNSTSPPKPSTCQTQITRNGVKYYLTNLTKLPDIQTMQFPPTYIKEGNCIYQLLNNPQPTPSQGDSFLCKTFPMLCSSQSSNLALSLHGRKMSVY